MSASTTPEVRIDPAVPKYLQKHQAETEFQIVLEVARELYPESRRIDVYLQEDPDVNDWWQVIVDVSLPESYPPDRYVEMSRRSAEKLTERLPPAQYPRPVCSLIMS